MTKSRRACFPRDTVKALNLPWGQSGVILLSDISAYSKFYPSKIHYCIVRHIEGGNYIVYSGTNIPYNVTMAQWVESLSLLVQKVQHKKFNRITDFEMFELYFEQHAACPYSTNV